MAKKTKQSKSKVTKKSPVKVEAAKPKSNEAKEAAIILSIIAAVIIGMYLLICGVPSFISGKAEIKTYQCYLTRDFKMFRVSAAYQALEVADMDSVKIYQIGESYTLLKDYDRETREERTRKFDFIRENYTQIPCEKK